MNKPTLAQLQRCAPNIGLAGCSITIIGFILLALVLNFEFYASFFNYFIPSLLGLGSIFICFGMYLILSHYPYLKNPLLIIFIVAILDFIYDLNPLWMIEAPPFFIYLILLMVIAAALSYIIVIVQTFNIKRSQCPPIKFLRLAFIIGLSLLIVCVMIYLVILNSNSIAPNIIESIFMNILFTVMIIVFFYVALFFQKMKSHLPYDN